MVQDIIPTVKRSSPALTIPPTIDWNAVPSRISSLAFEAITPAGVASVWHWHSGLHAGWDAHVTITFNQLTQLSFRPGGMFPTCENAQAWCEQWLRGRIAVQFYGADAPHTTQPVQVLHDGM